MIWVSHPTGNTFVRALLGALQRNQCAYDFFTTVATTGPTWWNRCLPERWHQELQRRHYEIPSGRCHRRPGRELSRLLIARLCSSSGVRWGGWSVDAVYRDLDRHVARLLQGRVLPDWVYTYEDGACETFRAAHARGVRCAYELPILYWEQSRRLLAEEALRHPDWAKTLGAPDDCADKCARKTEELGLADVVICPSQFVYRSLPEAIRSSTPCVVTEFGSPSSSGDFAPKVRSSSGRLRVLFAGTLTQRKGLADLFAAMRLLGRNDVELVVMGTPVMPLSFYRKQWAYFTYEAPRPHAGVLRLMRSCDVLVLPSIVEGRALVQHEGLSCGLPLIITPNTGGEDLIVEGETGFLTPMRDPAALAERIAWFANHRGDLETMRELARAKAAEFTWERYGRTVLETLGMLPAVAAPVAALP